MLPHFFTSNFFQTRLTHRTEPCIEKNGATLRDCVLSMFLLIGLLFIPMSGCAAEDATDSRQYSPFISIMQDVQLRESDNAVNVRSIKAVRVIDDLGATLRTP
jgi:hypothetical protein